MAEQGGIAIEKTRLLNRIQKLTMLFLDLSSSINSSLDIQEVLSNLTKNICDTLGMMGAHIRLLDEKTNSLKLVASHGLSDEFLEKGATTTTETAQRALKGETMVISTWRSIEDWNDWVKNDKRIAIQKEIDDLLGAETEYEVYE
mgnify:CR=1 FL=1